MNIYTNVHYSIIHNGEKVETTHQQMNGLKKNVVHLFNGLLFSHKKGLGSDKYYNIDEPLKHQAKKLVTKGQVLYDSTYMKYLG